MRFAGGMWGELLTLVLGSLCPTHAVPLPVCGRSGKSLGISLGVWKGACLFIAVIKVGMRNNFSSESPYKKEI